jgi:hypothetical protein
MFARVGQRYESVFFSEREARFLHEHLNEYLYEIKEHGCCGYDGISREFLEDCISTFRLRDAPHHERAHSYADLEVSGEVLAFLEDTFEDCDGDSVESDRCMKSIARKLRLRMPEGFATSYHDEDE